LTPQGDIEEKVTVVRTRLEEQLVTRANSPISEPGLAVEGLTPILMLRQLEPPPLSGSGWGFEDCANNGKHSNVKHASGSVLLNMRFDTNISLLTIEPSV
jgi:hypothetical protein